MLCFYRKQHAGHDEQLCFASLRRHGAGPLASQHIVVPDPANDITIGGMDRPSAALRRVIPHAIGVVQHIAAVFHRCAGAALHIKMIIRAAKSRRSVRVQHRPLFVCGKVVFAFLVGKDLIGIRIAAAEQQLHRSIGVPAIAKGNRSGCGSIHHCNTAQTVAGIGHRRIAKTPFHTAARTIIGKPDGLVFIIALSHLTQIVFQFLRVIGGEVSVNDSVVLAVAQRTAASDRVLIRAHLGRKIHILKNTSG